MAARRVKRSFTLSPSSVGFLPNAPLTTAIHRASPGHILLPAGESGLPADSAARAENLTVLRKERLLPADRVPRAASDARICAVAELVRAVMGCP